MKKILCAGLCILIFAGMAAGCGTSLQADVSTVYVDKKGNITFLDVGALDQDYYDEAELKAYVEERVDAYNGEHGKGSVKADGLSVENGRASLTMKYKTAEDFSGLHGIELYQGKVVKALAEGYTFDGDFASVKDGRVTGYVDKQAVYGTEDLKVVVIRANMDVKVEGEICYVSVQNVKLTGNDRVSIREGYDLKEEAPAGENAAAQGTEARGESSAAQSGGVFSADEFETDVYTYIIYK